MRRNQNRINDAMTAYSRREVFPEEVMSQCSLKEEALTRPRRKRIVFISEQQVQRPCDRMAHDVFEEEKACICMAGAQEMRARESFLRWDWTHSYSQTMQSLVGYINESGLYPENNGKLLKALHGWEDWDLIHILKRLSLLQHREQMDWYKAKVNGRRPRKRPL